MVYILSSNSNHNLRLIPKLEGDSVGALAVVRLGLAVFHHEETRADLQQVRVGDRRQSLR
jgi:hypothetical protein